MKRQYNLLETDITSLFFKYLLPGILGMMMVSAYVFVDTLCVGRSLGGSGLAALNICTPIISIFYATGFLFATGGAAAYSVLRGQKNYGKANNVYTLSLKLAIIIGILYSVFGLIFSTSLAKFLGATTSNIEITKAYMNVILFAAPVFITDILLNVFVRNDGAPKVSMIATICCGLLNVALDIIFIFGFGWGMFGAAFATTLSGVVSVCILFSYTLSKKSKLKIVKTKWEFSLVKRIIFNGAGSFILEASVAIVIIVFNLTILKLAGEIGVSAYSIIANLNLVIFSIFMGISQAIQPIISINYGAKLNNRISKILKLGIFSASILGITFLIIGELFSYQLASLFVKNDKELINMASKGIQIYFTAYIMMGVNIVLNTYYQSIEKPIQSLCISSGRGLVYVLACVWILPKFFNITGVWMSVPVAEFLTLLTALTFLAVSKINNKTEIEENCKLSA
jgi:putative MATE family efflux protein